MLLVPPKCKLIIVLSYFHFFQYYNNFRFCSDSINSCCNSWKSDNYTGSKEAMNQPTNPNFVISKLEEQKLCGEQ